LGSLTAAHHEKHRFFAIKSWLIFVIIIILVGTVLDYAVWFARWRPYLVWRSWFTGKLNKRNQAHALNELEQTDLDDMTRDQLANWVNTPQENYPVYDLSNLSSYDTYYPETENIFPPDQTEQYGMPSKMPANYTYMNLPGDISENPVYWQHTHSDSYESYQQQLPDQLSQMQWNTDSHQSAEYPYSPPLPDPSISFTATQRTPFFDNLTGTMFAEDQSDGDEYSQSSSHNSRQRRSERKKKGSGTFNLLDQIKKRLAVSDDQDSMLDGLPSPIRQEDAFHEAVYPQSYSYQKSPRTGENQHTNDHEN